MLHPQAVAAIELWSGEPGPGDPGFDIAAQRRTARDAAAAEPREPVAHVEDVDADGVACRLYVPDGADGAVVYLHGGGFVFGDLETHDAPSRRLANRAGLAVLSVDYRRPPEHRFPAAVEDTDVAVAWLRRQGPSYRLGPRLIALGDSAGGNLALVAAQRNQGVFDELVLVYPFLDPQQGFGSYAEENAGLTAAEAAWYWRQYAEHPEDLRDPDLAPLESDRLGTLPRTLVVAAEHDVLHDEDVELARRIAAAGGEVTVSTCPGMIHGFWRHPELFDAAEQSLEQIVGFLSAAAAD